MTPIREPIFVALWSLVLNASIAAGFTWVTSGRYLRHFDEVDITQMPCLFLNEHGEGWAMTGQGIAPKRVLHAHLFAYWDSAAPDQVLPATHINNMMDVLDTIITTPGNPQNVQTLGGLVQHVYIEGEVVIAEGLLQEKSILVVPINIMLP